MGIYLYSIRAKAHEVTLPNGEKVMAHEMKFLFNGGSFYRPGRLQQAMQAKADAYWEARQLPKYVILTGEEGAQNHDVVFAFTGKSPFWIDCNPFPGEKLAYLRKEGGRWIAGACQHEPRSEGSIPPFEEETGRDVCVHCSMVYGPENLERAAAYKVKMEKWAQEQLDQAARARAESERREAERKALVDKMTKQPVFAVEVEVGYSWVRGKLTFERKDNAETYAKSTAGAYPWRVVVA